MIREAQHSQIIEYGRLIARVGKKRKDRMALITAQIEVIVSHCLKLNMLPNHSSINHWQKEIALAFFNISKVRKPNGNNEDMERVAEWLDYEINPREMLKEASAIELEYSNTKKPSKHIENAIYEFIISEYENLLYNDKWTPKEVYKNENLNKIKRVAK